MIMKETRTLQLSLLIYFLLANLGHIFSFPIFRLSSSPGSYFAKNFRQKRFQGVVPTYKQMYISTA